MADWNEFKNLLADENLPPEHKKEVMATIDTMKLVANMVDMFSIKQAKTGTAFMSRVLGGQQAPDKGKKKDVPPTDDPVQ